jgi:hypothetical protein
MQLPIVTTQFAVGCAPLTGEVITAEDAEQLSHTFKALADATRVRCFH